MRKPESRVSGLDSLPAGTYNIIRTGEVIGQVLSAQQQFGTVATLDLAAAGSSVAVGGASIFLEVVAVNTATNIVTFRATSNILNSDGTVDTKVNDNLLVGSAGASLSSLGIGTSTMAIAVAGANGAQDYEIVHKIVWLCWYRCSFCSNCGSGHLRKTNPNGLGNGDHRCDRSNKQNLQPRIICCGWKRCSLPKLSTEHGEWTSTSQTLSFSSTITTPLLGLPRGF
jgi:hypothetical protein